MRNILLLGIVAVIGTGCSHAPVATQPPAIAAPTNLVVATPPAVAAENPDNQLFSRAQADLHALGYLSTSAEGPNDTVFQRALMAFERDHGLTDDGVLSAAVMEKLKSARLALRTPNPAAVAGTYLYLARASRSPITLGLPPDGYVSDTKGGIFAAIKVGAVATFHIVQKGGAPELVSCRIARASSESLSVMPDGLSVDCSGERGTAWHDMFSPRLGAVTRRQIGSKVELLVAVRPVTSKWPAPARTGLDWAISSALDGNGIAPIRWSSTGVGEKFEIHVAQMASTAQLGVKNATCRRLEMQQTGSNRIYPAFACKVGTEPWAIPGVGIKIATIMRSAENAK